MTTKLTHVDSLIITVGTRQVGWCCGDGVVRCLGADGDRGTPPHIDELYDQELELPRGYHQEGNVDSRWGVRHLGEQLYQRCIQNNSDFSAVELLLDETIVAQCVAVGLKRIILWGTNQPESEPWKFRRSDTLWLAKLMAGKIQAKWPALQKVEVIEPVIGAKDSERIRRELEETILPSIISSFSLKVADNSFVLAIQNTGCTPTVAQGLEICAAALVRQCQVLNINPIEPDSLYVGSPDGFRTAYKSQKFQFISVGDYFWPLERLRVISSWERGDFREAEIWLTSHQNRYKGLLYQLAGRLALSTNWEIYKFLQDKDRGIESWLQLETLTEFAQLKQIQAWQEQLQNLQVSGFAQAWESSFLIYLQLYRDNYTTAFMQFSQTLERLLYIRAKEEDWLGKGLIELPNGYLGNRNEPSFFLLINAWCKLKLLDGNKWSILLHRVREKRNQIVHNAKPINPSQVKALWSDDGLFKVIVTGNHAKDIMQLMSDVLHEVCDPTKDIPKQPLLHSLYEWGLFLLRT